MSNTSQADSSGGDVLQPLDAYTSDDHSSIIMIVTIVSCLVMSTTIAAKFSVQRKIRRRNLFDPVLVGGAWLLLIQSALIVYAAHCGLGKSEDELAPGAVEKIQQVQSSFHSCFVCS